MSPALAEATAPRSWAALDALCVDMLEPDRLPAARVRDARMGRAADGCSGGENRFCACRSGLSEGVKDNRLSSQADGPK